MEHENHKCSIFLQRRLTNKHFANIKKNKRTFIKNKVLADVFGSILGNYFSLFLVYGLQRFVHCGPGVRKFFDVADLKRFRKFCENDVTLDIGIDSSTSNKYGKKL